MSLYKTHEEKYQRKLENMRRREEERKKKFFDHKNRMYGVDKDAIEKQIEEKKRKLELEKMRDLYFDKQMKDNSNLALHMTNIIEKKKTEKLKEIHEFRKRNQKKEQRKEWDLNDPEQLKNQVDGRLTDFHGEDLNKKERVKMQQEQMRRWIEEKKQEEEQINEKKRQEKIWYDNKLLEMNSLAKQIEQKQRNLKLNKTLQTAQYNIDLSELKREKERRRAELEEMKGLNHIFNQKTSPFLNEHFQTTITNPNSKYTGKKYIPYNFKGLSHEENEKIKAIRKQQIKEKKLREQREKEEKIAFDKYMIRNSRLATINANMMQRKKQEKLKEHVEFLKKQDQLHKDKVKFFDKVYEGKITEDFFKQFGNNSR